MQANILSLISLEFVNRPSIDFNSQQRKLLSQNATFSFFFGPVRYHIWKEFLAIMVSEGYHWKMFQNNEAFASLVVIGIVTLGSRSFSGRSAAVSGLLLQRSQFHLPQKNLFTNLKNK